MSTKALLTTLFLVAAGPASAECVYKNVYDHLNGEYITVPFSCPPVKASQTPEFHRWHECPVYEVLDAKTDSTHRVRICA